MPRYKKFMVKDFGDIITGNTPSTTKVDYWNGDIPFYSPADFTENVYCVSTKKTITELGGTMPEDLPTPKKSLKQLEKEKNKKLKE